MLTYSGTYVNQQWPHSDETPHGAWEYHEHLIPNSPAKPIRIWLEVGDRDLLNPNTMRDNMHDWPMNTWPKRWLPKAIIINSSSPAMPDTEIMAPDNKPSPKPWNGCGRITSR